MWSLEGRTSALPRNILYTLFVFRTTQQGVKQNNLVTRCMTIKKVFPKSRLLSTCYIVMNVITHSVGLNRIFPSATAISESISLCSSLFPQLFLHFHKNLLPCPHSTRVLFLRYSLGLQRLMRDRIIDFLSIILLLSNIFITILFGGIEGINCLENINIFQGILQLPSCFLDKIYSWLSLKNRNSFVILKKISFMPSTQL